MSEQSHLFIWIRRLLLILPAALLAIIEYFHPAGFYQNTYSVLSSHIQNWLIIHLMQLPLFGLITVGMWFLLDGFSDPAAIISKIAMWFFLIFYGGFDAIAGIGIGKLIEYGHTLPPEQQNVIAGAVNKLFLDPITGGLNSFMSLTGSYAWLIGLWAAAFSLFRAGKNPIPLFFLLISGLAIWRTHAYPYGPIGFTFFLIAIVWLEFFPSQRVKA
jgi:hypothetical protein